MSYLTKPAEFDREDAQFASCLEIAVNRLLKRIDPDLEPDDSYRRLLQDAVHNLARAELEINSGKREITHLRRLSVTDEATGILNRRGFTLALEQALERTRRFGETGILIMIDLDGFKQVNDNFGHSAGDMVLAGVALALKRNIRNLDVVARLGGDEFALLLTQVDPQNGRQKAGHLEEMVNNLTIPWGDQVIAVRASFGVETYGLKDDGSNLLDRADQEMYARKKSRATALTYAAD